MTLNTTSPASPIAARAPGPGPRRQDGTCARLERAGGRSSQFSISPAAIQCPQRQPADDQVPRSVKPARSNG